MHIVRPVELTVFLIYLLYQSGDFTAKTCATKDDALFLRGLRGVEGHADGITWAGIDIPQRIQEHKHGVRHMDVQRKRAVGRELDNRRFLLAHKIVTHDNRETAIYLVKHLLRNLIDIRFFWHYYAALEHHIAAMQTELVKFPTGVVQQLWHFLCLYFFL